MKVSEVVSEMETLGDGISIYLNRKTGDFLPVTDDDLGYLEANEDGLRPWQIEQMKAVKEALNSPDYVNLPQSFDLDEWSVMSSFCDAITDGDVADELREAIHGRGAFRRFKACLQQHDLESAWYRFREEAYAEIAVEWLEEKGIAYENDVANRS